MMEIKKLPLSALELKFTEGMKFSGYASAFGLVDSYGDTIQKGAYTETLKSRERPIRLRWNHHGAVVGKWLSITEDEKGLFVEGELTPNHSLANDIYASMKHGAVDGMSIGYRVKAYEQLPNDRRLLKQIELVEISIVEEPADLGAKIAEVKSMIEQSTSLKEIETLLRDAGGFSRNDATALVSRIKSLYQSDSDAEKRQQEALKQAFESFKAK
jgi:HK97 family phage prohead protease